VPISSASPSIICAPAKITATWARTPSSSIAGKKIDESFCARVFERRFASFRPSNSRWKVRSWLKACTTAIPATDSASWAVTAAIRVRTSVNAAWERRWNQRVMRSPGGRTSKATRPRRQSSRNRPPIAATRVKEFTTTVVRPWLSTSESASTSLVRRAMIQPAFCSEK
jgi:hypothetical protein